MKGKPADLDIKKITAYILTVVFSIIFIVFFNNLLTGGESILGGKSGQEYVRGEVEKIISTKKNEFGDTYITFTLSSGERTITAVQIRSESTMDNIRPVEKGDDVIIVKNANSPQYYFSEFIRSDGILILGGIFCVLLIVFGRTKGINTILSLAFTCVSIFYVMIPAILLGKNIYLWTAVTLIYITVSTLLLVNGYNRKSLAAAIGCIGGVMVSYIIARVTDLFVRMSGYIDEGSIYLSDLPYPIDLKAIIYASILIGAIGAIMDVSVELSASLWEISGKVKTISFKELFMSGMNIGRETMGTMSNTLILAYIGGGLSGVLLMVANSSSLLFLFNMETVVFEILQALCGSIGILFCIPLTSAVSGVLFRSK